MDGMFYRAVKWRVQVHKRMRSSMSFPLTVAFKTVGGVKPGGRRLVQWKQDACDVCNASLTLTEGLQPLWRPEGEKSYQIITYNEDWRRSYTTHTFCISYMRFTLENDPICSRQLGLWFKIEASWILRALFSRFKKDKDALDTHDVKWNARLSLTTDRSAEESTLCGVSRLKMNYLYNLSSRGVKAMTVVAQWRCTKDIDRTGHWHATKSLFSPINSCFYRPGCRSLCTGLVPKKKKKKQPEKKINIRHRLSSTAAFGAIPPPPKKLPLTRILQDLTYIYTRCGHF